MVKKALREDTDMKPPLINATNVLYLTDMWLHLPTQAFRPPYRKHRHGYQAELVQSLNHYQRARQIRLPTGQPALQTQQHRLHTLVRKLNYGVGLLTEAAFYQLSQQAGLLAFKESLKPVERLSSRKVKPSNLITGSCVID